MVDKNFFILITVFILVVVAVNVKKKDVGNGCCQVHSTVCASGDTVTEKRCTTELDGEWVANTQCNVNIGTCE